MKAKIQAILLTLATLAAITVIVLAITSQRKYDLSHQEDRIISADPCKLPCLISIEMGDSKEVVETKLKDHGYQYRCTLKSSQSLPDYVWYDCGSIKIKINEIVDEVEGLSYTLEKKVKFSQLISSYGEPDTVTVLENQLFPEEDISYIVRLCYSRINSCFESEPHDVDMTLQKWQYFDLASGTIINMVSVYTESDYLENLDYSYNDSWKGYGKYFFDSRNSFN